MLGDLNSFMFPVDKLNISFVYSKSVSILFYHYDLFIHFDDLFADLFC